MSNEKPDGWVAWHERHGVDKESFSARQDGVITAMNGRSTAGYHPAVFGWRIRPVKLVFLDEKEPSDER